MKGAPGGGGRKVSIPLRGGDMTSCILPRGIWEQNVLNKQFSHFTAPPPPPSPPKKKTGGGSPFNNLRCPKTHKHTTSFFPLEILDQTLYVSKDCNLFPFLYDQTAEVGLLGLPTVIRSALRRWREPHNLHVYHSRRQHTSLYTT